MHISDHHQTGTALSAEFCATLVRVTARRALLLRLDSHRLFNGFLTDSTLDREDHVVLDTFTIERRRVELLFADRTADSDADVVLRHVHAVRTNRRRCRDADA
jgi:hypothetical protein